MSDRLLKESDVLKAIDKRIEELSKHPEFVRKNGNIDVMGVKKHILAIPSADRPQGWIPCSERLPENSIRVLVQADDMYHTTDTNNGILTGWRRGDYWYTFTIRGCETIRYPLAWMPLPKPWKGADDEIN